MSLPDVCSLWIEQRIDEEKDTGKSLREIGRMIAEEVQKHFEVKVSPMTIFSKARRVVNDSNESPTENPEISTTKPELEKLEKTQHGGARFGSGRKPIEPEKTPSERIEENIKSEITKCRAQQEEKKKVRVRSGMADGRDYIREVETVSDGFKAAHTSMWFQILEARQEGWISTTRVGALKKIEALTNLITMECRKDIEEITPCS
jgi:hypothetical protein